MSSCMIKVIATDLDGTLFYPKKRYRMICGKTKKFLQRFIDDGGKLVLVSGRNKAIEAKFREKTGIEADLVGCNGSVIIEKGQVIKSTSFNKESLKKILFDIRRDYDPPMVLLMSKKRNLVYTRTDVSHITNLAYFLWWISNGTYRDPFVRSDRVFYEELETGEVYKAMVLFGATKKKIIQAREATALLNTQYPDAEFSWINQMIEISPKGCTKKDGLEFYLDYNKIPRDNVVVVGDSGNDISMFDAWKEQSFCMEHGRPEVKAHAGHVIKNFYDLEDYLYPLEEK
jgi:Cof subfamily protein (haloacid dehalogenase superfamily)